MRLYDTSSVFEGLKRGKALAGYVLDLTLYEFSNVLWKHVRLLKKLSKGEVSVLLRSFLDQEIRVLRVEPEDLQEILVLAIEAGITVYDAAYIYYARKLGLELKTLDRRLLRAYEGVELI